MTATIFLTGGTGFIGGHFLSQALAAGHRVIALRRPATDSPFGSAPRLSWIEATLAEVPTEILARCDTLVHLAAVGVTPQRATSEELFNVNVSQSLTLWQRAADAGIARFVICGSCAEYGRAAERYPAIPPDAPLEPNSMYAASKAASSMAAFGFAAERSRELALLRPFHVFGEGQHAENFWPALRAAALAGHDFPMTGGEQVRDYVPVEQVAAFFVAAVNRPDLIRGKPLVENIGTGAPQTLRHFAEHWWTRWQASGRLLAGALPYRVNEVMRYVPQVAAIGGPSPRESV
jgi:nucleoside-diphosphate-sugar epimerase